jgi:hypothetical protein
MDCLAVLPASRPQRAHDGEIIDQRAAFAGCLLRLPGTNFRFGADAVIGLVPGFGDVGGAAIGLFIVNEARRLGLPNHKLAIMLANIGLDVFGGSIPIVGDLFDAYFKANWRNLEMALDHFGMSVEDLKRLR